MKLPRICRDAVVALVALAAGCASTNYAADLANNELFYTDVPFQTKAPGDREVFVAPLVDGRDPATLPAQEQGFPIVYGGEEFWERPVREMVADVLGRQLQKSGLFAVVADRATAQTLVLKPTLVKFTTGAMEEMAGARSFAEVGLRLQLFGPVDAAGKRAVLLDANYDTRQMSERGLKPVSPYLLVGRALQASMGKALAGIDGSNASRSHVPMAEEVPGLPAEPAEAAARPAR